MKTNPTQQLHLEIAKLELRQKHEAAAIKQEFEDLYEKSRPLNLLKSKLHELTQDPDLRHNLVNASIGLGAGYLSKFIAVGRTHNPIKKLVGLFLQMGVTNAVASKGDAIKHGAMKVVQSFLGNQKKEA